ncbi:MAG: fibronectin type III domain-containing protein [Chitinophagaceae bacterium]|nr:fibronectin type III domain-containing protein [Chitinophagaceae bacterium]
MLRYLTLIILLLVGFKNSQAQTFTWNGNVPILDLQSDTILIPVSGLPTVIDSNFGIAHVCINITHTYDNDLVIKLFSADDDSVTLIQGIGGANNDFIGTCMGMDGTLFSNATAPYSGIFIPVGDLSELNDGHDPNGVWKLVVTDVANADTGSIHMVSIEFTNNPPMSGSLGGSPTGTYLCATCTCPNNAPSCDLLPDMTSSAKEIQLSVIETPGALQIANATPNIGIGPLEIYAIDSCFCDNTPVPCTTTTCPPGQQLKKAIKQRIYQKVAGTDTLNYYDHLAGMMTYHPTHGHLHVDSFVSYTLRTATSNPDATTWPIVATGTKQSFCLINIGSCSGNVGECKDGAGNTVTTVMNHGLGFHSGCGTTQGIYAGYYDVYGVGLNEPIPLNNVCNGNYYIVSITDPLNFFLESDETNNWVAVPVTLTQQNPAPIITASGPTSFCNGDSVILTCNASSNYLWSNGATTQSITVNTAGTFHVTVNCGTSSSTSTPITTSVISPSSTAAVSIAITAGSNPSCAGMPITFTATAVNGGSNPTFIWYVDGVVVGGNSSTLTYSFSTGNQIVHCTMISSSGCLLNTTGISNDITINLTTCYCIPVYGTTATSGCMDGDLIWRFKLNTLDNLTGSSCPSGIAGYYDYTSSTNPALTTILQAGTSYTATVTAGQFAEGYRAWIDYNNDGVFSASEVIGYTPLVVGSGQLGVIGSSGNFTVTLPCNAPAGPHRLRVRCAYNISGIALDPCAFINNYGEVEDYLITIVAAPTCSAPSNLSATAITNSGATLAWTLGCTETLWNVHITFPGMGAPISGNGSNPGVTNPYIATGLKAGTTYEYWVQAHCGINNTSVWVGPFNFTTLVNCAIQPGISLTQPIVIGEVPCVAYPYLTSTTNSTGSCFTNNYTGANNQASADVWFQFTVANTSTVQISTCGSGFDTYLHVLNASGTQLLFNDDNGPACNTLQASISSTLSPGTYYIVAEGYNTNTGTIQLKVNTTQICPTLSGKCYLQGYYNTAGLMYNVLYLQGKESNPASTNVDTINVMLKSSTFPYATQYSVKTLLQTNGTFICNFPQMVLGSSYYIVLKHRNALETWSASAVPFALSTAYDFTTSLSMAFGDNQTSLSGGVYGLYSGDINQDGAIDGFDFNAMEPDIILGTSGYLASDLNGDGIVDAFDFLLVEQWITNGVGSIAP